MTNKNMNIKHNNDTESSLIRNVLMVKVEPDIKWAKSMDIYGYISVDVITCLLMFLLICGCYHLCYYLFKSADAVPYLK